MFRERSTKELYLVAHCLLENGNSDSEFNNRHSGAGYQNSVGVARKVVKLIGEFAEHTEPAA